MSRTYKDRNRRKGCPNGTCPYCISNRLHKHQKQIKLIDALKDLK